MKRTIGKLLLSLSVLMIGMTAMAQETTSEIQGTVSSGKEKLAGATVTALHTPTGTVYKTTTRQDGRYNLPNVKIGGPYTVSVSYVGYKPSTEDDITLVVGQVYKQNFELVQSVTTLKEIGRAHV